MRAWPTQKCGYCGCDKNALPGGFYYKDGSEDQCSDCYDKGLDWIKEQPPAVESTPSTCPENVSMKDENIDMDVEARISDILRQPERLKGNALEFRHKAADYIDKLESDITQQREQIAELKKERDEARFWAETKRHAHWLVYSDHDFTEENYDEWKESFPFPWEPTGNPLGTHWEPLPPGKEGGK